MDNFPMNPADLAVVVVLLLAALLAFARGLVAEVLSLAAWLGASLVAMHGLPYLLPVVQQHVHVPMLAYGLSAVALFVVALLVFSTAAGQIGRLVQNSSLSAVDRSLGFVFGLAKGAFLVSVAYLFFVWLVPRDEHPGWLKEARTQPLLEMGAATLYEWVPENLRAEGLAQAGLARDRARQAAEAQRQLDRLSTPVPPGSKTDAEAAERGYNRSERGNLDQLFQQTAPGPAPGQ